MPSCHLSDISISFGHRTILESVSFSISSQDRIALAGANGSGKSTLLKIIAGGLAPDAGKMTLERGTRISYLPQSGAQAKCPTLYEEAECAFDAAKALIDEAQRLEEILASHNETSADTEELLARHHLLHETIAELDYYSRDREIHRVLKGLGFAEIDFNKNPSSFSSGWQMRIALAKVLLEKADILLLDEPTNYLDLEARNWLEGYLADFHGSALIVSHDRYFLDRNVRAVAEVYLRKLTVYKGNYTKYEERREQELESISDAYTAQQEEVAKTEMFIRRFRYNSSKAKLVQSRMRYLDKLVRIEKPPTMRKIHFSFPLPPQSSDCALEVQSVSKAYGDRKALDNVSFTLSKGERLVLLGPNGAGKTTLIKILAGLLSQDSGKIVYGKGVQTGCFLQDRTETAVENTTIIDRIESIAPTELIPRLRALLGAFLFTGDDIHKQVSVLSGGERSRLLLIELLLHPANLLLLDEPTNHLDLASKDILLDALTNYNATLVFVSHDPYFIKQCATKVLALENGKATYYFGDYEYYLYRQDHPLDTEDQHREEKKDKSVTVSEGRIVREEEKKKRNLVKKLEKEDEELLAGIEGTEASLAELEARMSEEEVYASGEKMRDVKKRIDDQKQKYEGLLAQWEENDKKLKALKDELSIDASKT